MTYLNLEEDIDNIAESVMGSEDSGTATYEDVAGGEQDIISKTTTFQRKVDTIWVNTTNMTQSGVLTLKYQGEEVDSWSVDASEKWNEIPGKTFGAGKSWSVTYTEDADEGVDRSVDWEIQYGDDK